MHQKFTSVGKCKASFEKLQFYLLYGSLHFMNFFPVSIGPRLLEHKQKVGGLLEIKMWGKQML